MPNNKRGRSPSPTGQAAQPFRSLAERAWQAPPKKKRRRGGRGGNQGNNRPPNNPNREQDKINEPVKRPPAGFKDQAEFEAFAKKFKEGLEKAGYPDAIPLLGGSATIGRSPTKGHPFDGGKNPDGTPKKSDFDLAIVDPKLVDDAIKAGAGGRNGDRRTGELTDAQLDRLGLKDLRDELQKTAGRPLGFMPYRDKEFAGDRPLAPVMNLVPPYEQLPRKT
ncbi:hypothetical protein [Glycomyces tenuis]|uniref:hypothetical protein n=1 Tax=Glycomyces tenuis TaxID=58116 RepID=UPI00047EA6D6|nr:hypothetical protein [Glycomyces tenuis]